MCPEDIHPNAPLRVHFVHSSLRVRSRTRTSTAFTDPSRRKHDRQQDPPIDVRDEKILRERLGQLRGQLLQWGTPDLIVFVTTKDELRGWIRALEWVLKLSRTIDR